MWYELIAVSSAMGWAADSILIRKGSQYAHVYGAAFLSYLFTSVCLWIAIALTVPFHQLRSPALVYFVLSGCLQPLLARLLHYTGITRLGVTRATPLRSVSPLFAVLLAVAFLSERPTPLIYGGGFLIVIGGWLVLWEPAEERDWRLFDIIFPLGAALTVAVSQVFRRTGLLLLPNPFVGAAVTTSTSLVLFVASLFAMGKWELIKPRPASLPYFGSSAIVSSASQFFAFWALSGGELSIIAPLVNTTPFFAVQFSAIFLRNLERITPRLCFGVLLLVTGVILITAG